MNRIFVLIAVFVFVVGQPACRQKPKSTRPNLLLITIDTLRADYLGCYGSADVKTPHIDALAASGVQFMRHVAPSQCTNPAHASILTGLYPTIHGVMDNRTALADEALCLAEILKKRGYYTLGAVSVRHMNPDNSNFSQGFMEFLDCQPVELNARERNREFLEKLRTLPTFPYFAWVHYFDPHGIYNPPAPYDKMYPVGTRYDPVPPHNEMNLTEQQKSGPVDPDVIIPLYKGEISFLDAHLGELLQALKEEGIYENTLIVLVADHGESMVEKGIYFCHAGMYNPVLHIPLIMSFPGKLPRGIRVDSTTSSVDIFPTVLRVLGIPFRPHGIDGKNLSPTFSNPRRRVHESVVSEAVNGVIRAVYKGGYKFIKPFPTDWACKESHLFRGWEDYLEETELKHAESAAAQELESLLEDWLRGAQKNTLASKRHQQVDRKNREALKTLGYLK